MITATSKKDGEYYRATLKIKDGDYKQEYHSTDMFLDKKTAQKQAEWWKAESIEIGQVIDF